MIQIQERIGKLVDHIGGLINEKSYQVRRFEMKHTDGCKEDPANIPEEGWSEITEEAVWGGHREHFYFRTEFTVPEEAAGKRLIMELRTGREGLWDALNPQFLAYVNGKISCGLDVNHREVFLTDHAVPGETFQLLLCAYTGDDNHFLRLDAKVNISDAKIEKYYYDVKVPFDVAFLLDAESDAYIEIIQSLNRSLNLFDLRKPYSEAFYQSLEEAENDLQENFYKKYCGNAKHTVWATGHTHIDLAWLWTLSTTEDKTVRSFSTVLDLMKRYPEYKFMHSTPQEYIYVKKNAPEIYEQVKERIKEGRWEPEGGMFVEADCNISSGEALVRQFLYGIRFFDKEFGKRSRILWLPDVFGYSAALPQIMQQFGVPYFMTTKISWNEFNKMPYDTFLWEGVDGTRVLTHFIPARDYSDIPGVAGFVNGKYRNGYFTTYNGNLNASQVMGSWQRYSQKDINDDVLMSYGYGDGGGGPTREMLENQRRLAEGIPGSPATKTCLPSQFFEKLEADVKGNPDLPVWDGELYLEYHRGTYTSMARNKKFNRRSEFACQNLEYFAFLAQALLGCAYPKEALDESWEIVLRNQFHDILPGSSIKEVYEESKLEYEHLLEMTAKLQAERVQALADAADGDAGDLVIFNPNGSEAASEVVLDGWKGGAITDGTQCFQVQETEDGPIALISGVPQHGYRVFKAAGGADEASAGAAGKTAGGVATASADAAGKTAGGAATASADAAGKTAGGVATASADAAGKTAGGVADAPAGATAKTTGGTDASADTAAAEECPGKFDITAQHVETSYFSIRLNEKGQFESIYDKAAGRELLQAGACANVLMTYEDRPHNYDNWDINIYYKEKSWAVDQPSKIEVVEEGPVRGCIRITYPYLTSSIVEYLYFYPDQYRFDIRFDIDWKEDHIVLRDLFPVDIHSSETTYEIQYGNVKRANHYNTSWDYAKFEVCAHKWLDFSEDNYGLSVLNDSKFGYSVHDRVIGLTLLKSGTYPNPDADKEFHTFRYSFCPHSGDFRSAGTVARAYALNNPMVAVVKEKAGEQLPACTSFVQTDVPNVVVEVVKHAEDSGDLIVRCYECWNRRSRVKLSIGAAFKEAAVCSPYEEDVEAAVVEDGKICFEMKPFEIRSFRVKL